MDGPQQPESLRAHILLLLAQHSKTGSPEYVTDEQLATATGQPIDEIRRQLDILEELGLTTTANTHQGRRARISTPGLLAEEQLRTGPVSDPEKPRIGFNTEN